MAYPDDQLPAASTWFTNTLINAALMQANITDPLNAVAAAASLGLVGVNTDTSTITLSTTAAFASGASVTFTVPTSGRTYLVLCVGRFAPSASAGSYGVMSAYNSGSSVVLGSSATLGLQWRGSSSTGNATGLGMGRVTLTAGTYTAFAQIQRISGGSASDTSNGTSVLVLDIGT